MNAKQLETILLEYPPSRKLIVVVDGHPAQETTVVEMIIKLGSAHDPSVNFFGRDSCIIRERLKKEGPDDKHSIPFSIEWLEIDLR
jgi:hypothetical protein